MSREQLQWLVLGHRTAAAIAAAVELGLVDLLAERPRTATDLAEAAGTDPDATSRLLRALVAVDLVEQDAERRFALTELGAPLRSDAPASLRSQALLQADPAVWAAWGHLAHSVRTGENAFTAKHGTDVWAHRAEHPEHNANFNALMASRSRGGGRRRRRVVRLLRGWRTSWTSAAAEARSSPRFSGRTRT